MGDKAEPDADPGPGSEDDLVGQVEFGVVAVLASMLDDVTAAGHFEDDVGGGAFADDLSVMFERHSYL